MHVARKWQRNKEHCQTDGVHCPQSHFYIFVINRCKQISQCLCHKSSVAVICSRITFSQKSQRENEPQRELCKTVEQHVLCYPTHSDNLRVHHLYNSKRNTRKHKQKQRIHYVRKDNTGCSRMLMHEEPVEYRNPEWFGTMNAYLGFDCSYQYEKKPSESNAAVHIAQNKVTPENLTMEQTFQNRLPYCWKEFQRKNILLYL